MPGLFVIALLSAALQYQPWIMAVTGQQFGNYDHVPLIAAIGEAESNWNPKAVSPTGCKGPMQFCSIARKQVCLNDPRLCGGDPFDVRWSIKAAVNLLAWNYARFYRRSGCERWRLAVASYNSGAGHVGSALRRLGADWLRGIRAEGRNYVPKVLKYEKAAIEGGWVGVAVC